MSEKKVFEASTENKGKAKQLRLFAILAWIIAIATEGFFIYKILKVSNYLNDSITWVVVGVVAILVLVVLASILWKKANKLDPASEKNKVKFFIQSQLGAIMSAIAFLPLIILVFTNKDANKQTKGIVGGVAVVALLIASIVGIDFDPASIEKYTEEINAQTEVVKSLNHNQDNVYWTKAGNKYHIFSDCQHIKGREEIHNGTTKESWDEKGISELCKTCENRAIREKEKNVLEE